MKLLIRLISLLSVSGNLLFAQVLTTKPAFPTADKEIEIIIDLKLVKDTRAAGLIGKSTDVYLWAWGGSDLSNKKSEFGPEGQSSFSIPFEPGKMTSLGADKWSIKLTPNKYLKVGADKTLKWMGCLLKNGNGTSQTEDLLFDFFDNKLSTSFTTPLSSKFFVDANSKLNVIGKASQTAKLSLSLDGSIIKTVQSDSISIEINTGNLTGQDRLVEFIAETSAEKSISSFSFSVKPSPKVLALPVGIKDGINYSSDTQITFSLFAPNKSFVYLLGEFNNWQSSPEYLMHKTPDGNRYWLEIKDLIKGQEYAYQFLVDGTIPVGDPYSEKILDRTNDGFIGNSTFPNLKKFPNTALGNIVSVFQTGQTAFDWKIKDFKKPEQSNLVIYELLVRDFSSGQSYKAVADSIGYFKKMGINCIELMPIMEFTGNDSWGYNPTFYFAPDKAYGPSSELKKMIDICHQNGIAVVLDMVLNQADYEFPYVKMYWDGTQPSKNSPFFNQQATHPYSVFFDFNHESQATKDLTDRICQHWVQEYKMDGFRFDLAKGFTQVKSTDDAGFKKYDPSRVAIWKRIYDKIKTYDKTAFVILELFADDTEEQELADYGMMLWGNLNGEFRNLIKGNPSSFSRISHLERRFSQANLVGYIESHDEQRLLWDALNNGKEINGYSTKVLANACNRAKALAALSILTPGPKMIWQFGELGYDIPIDENGRTGRKPLKWDYLQNLDRLNLFKVYSELIKLKTTNNTFKTINHNLSVSGTKKLLNIENAEMKAIVVANLDMSDLIENVGFTNTGTWFDFFTGQEVTISDLTEKAVLKPGEFHVYTNKKLLSPPANLVPWPAYTKSIILANEPNLDTEILGYPNPAEDRFEISIKNSFRGKVDVKISNSIGQTISNYQFNKMETNAKFEINIKDLVSGLYILEVNTFETNYIKLLKK